MDTQRVGERIQQLRHRRGWNQADLAGLVNLTQVQISRIEHGQRLLSLERAVDFAHALGVDITALLNDTLDTEYAVLEEQSGQASHEIAVRRQRIAALQNEVVELQRQVAYYEIVVHTAEQRMADLTDALDEDNDEDEGFEAL